MQSFNNPMNWSEFEKNMIKQFPFLPKDFTKTDVAPDASRINEYVQKTIRQYLNQQVTPGSFNPFAVNEYNYDVFETHRSVIVRLHLPDHVSPHDIKTSISQRKLRFTFPSGKRQDIQLEKPINSKKARSLYKEGVLEVRLPKIREQETFHEVYLDE